MAYQLSKPLEKKKFPISDYIRLGIMGIIIILTILVLKIGGFLSNKTETVPAIEDQPFPGKRLEAVSE